MMNELSETFERRLPVYLVLDCSESMVGEGIEAVNAGMRQVFLDLYSDPHALETVWVSVITFDHEARQVIPLTELTSIKAPALKVRPGTNLGGALKLLQECIKREVRTHSAQSKGDWKPLVFLLTDGAPTDNFWQQEAQKIRESTSSGGKQLNLICIGCGEDVDPLALMQLSDTVLMMSDKPSDLRALFQWISSSLSVASQSLATQPIEGGVQLAKIPQGLMDAPPKEAREKTSHLPAHLFIASRCSVERKPYLMRYHLVPEHNVYQAIGAHVVDEEYFAGQNAGETMNSGPASLNLSSSQLFGVPPCPHCHNPIAGQCMCGQTFCCPPGDEPVQCPGCLRTLGFGSDGEFSLSGRAG